MTSAGRLAGMLPIRAGRASPHPGHPDQDAAPPVQVHAHDLRPVIRCFPGASHRRRCVDTPSMNTRDSYGAEAPFLHGIRGPFRSSSDRPLGILGNFLGTIMACCSRTGRRGRLMTAPRHPIELAQMTGFSHTFPIGVYAKARHPKRRFLSPVSICYANFPSSWHSPQASSPKRCSTGNT